EPVSLHDALPIWRRALVRTLRTELRVHLRRHRQERRLLSRRPAMRRVLLHLLPLFVVGFAGGAQAGLPTYELTIRDGHFEPATLEVPARQRFKIIINNAGSGPTEFESTPLRVEKVLSAGVTSFVVI